MVHFYLKTLEVTLFFILFSNTYIIVASILSCTSSLNAGNCCPCNAQPLSVQRLSRHACENGGRYCWQLSGNTKRKNRHLWKLWKCNEYNVQCIKLRNCIGIIRVCRKLIYRSNSKNAELTHSKTIQLRAYITSLCTCDNCSIVVHSFPKQQ